MAKQLKQPVLMTVITEGKSFQYELADKLDWAVMFDGTVLEINGSIEGKCGAFYWPVASVTLWKVEPCVPA